VVNVLVFDLAVLVSHAGFAPYEAIAPFKFFVPIIA
jgi:hypothetical protein